MGTEGRLHPLFGLQQASNARPSPIASPRRELVQEGVGLVQEDAPRIEKIIGPCRVGSPAQSPQRDRQIGRGHGGGRASGGAACRRK
jgi:hypothetical protein